MAAMADYKFKKVNRFGDRKSLGYDSPTGHPAKSPRLASLGVKRARGAIQKRAKPKAEKLGSMLAMVHINKISLADFCSCTPSVEASSATKKSPFPVRPCRRIGGCITSNPPSSRRGWEEAEDWEEEDDEEEPEARWERVEGWEEKYEKKKWRKCCLQCPTCGSFCNAEHPRGEDCLPCHDPGLRLFGFMGEDTAVGGPVELSVARKRYTARVQHRLVPWSFSLKGKQCSFICIVQYGGKHQSLAANLWLFSFHRLLIWRLLRDGFDDEAIADVFSRVHESTYDKYMEDADEEVETIPMKEFSPAHKVMVMVAWGGRVKIAGQWEEEEVVMVGDNQVGPGKSYKVMCYGQPHTEVCIREGKVCSNDVFMMVPKGLEREKLSSVAKKHDDVAQMAQELIKLEEVRDCTWVAKFT